MKKTVASFVLSISVQSTGLIVSGCSSNTCIEIAAWETGIRDSIPPDLIAPDELESLLVQFLRAQCTCEFSAELISKITTGVDIDDSESYEVDPRSCIGAVEIIHISRGDERQIAIEVSPHGSREEYLIVMFYSERGWLTYWPEIPGLHP